MLIALFAAALASPKLDPGSINKPVSGTAPVESADVESLDALLPSVKNAQIGRITFDTRLPAEIRVDGMVVAQLFTGGEYTVNTSVGPHDVIVLTNGIPRTGRVDVPVSGRATVVVGRTA